MIDLVSSDWWQVRRRQQVMTTCQAVLTGHLGILEGSAHSRGPMRASDRRQLLHRTSSAPKRVTRVGG